MTPKKQCHGSKSKTKSAKTAEHLQLLAELEQLELADSCCNICHCDCYSGHSNSSSSNVSGRGKSDAQQTQAELRLLEQEIAALECLQRCESADRQAKTRSKPTKRSASRSPEQQRRGSAECSSRVSTAGKSRRSKSVGSEPRDTPTITPKQPQRRAGGAAKDCQILQALLAPLGEATPQLHISAKAKSKSQNDMSQLPPRQQADNTLCASMANLCLAPTVRAAYQQVPTHDQKILNRMAVKRSQQAADKEHAWLARKYWENERLERELLKCEQLEEYKRAVHDKQFQDYLLSKARLQALAQRDLAELQRLRHALDAKDAAAKQRIAARRLERDIQLCQRRCEELRRSEAVNVQQVEQQQGATLRKREAGMRLTQRQRRADQLRHQLLDGYLRRLQHDNQVQQLHHEEHWRERQQYELLKREQLKADIQRKRRQSQRFVEGRQRRHEATTRTAKISASLRELVRQSVTPEAATTQAPLPLDYYTQQQLQLSRLLFEQ